MDERTVALQIAQKAHEGQKDKVDEDYIKHPLTVSSYCKTERGQIAALLHDVVEDSNFTLKDLRSAGIGEDVIMAVKCLTKTKNEKLTDYYNRVALNDIATEVKFADMRHNSDKSRFPKDKQKEADENYQKYFERAKDLSRIAGKERSKSLMTDETYLWLSNSKMPKEKRVKIVNAGKSLAEARRAKENEGKEIKSEGYCKHEQTGEIYYMRHYTDGCTERTQCKTTGMFIIGSYPPYDAEKAMEFIKKTASQFRSWEEKAENEKKKAIEKADD